MCRGNQPRPGRGSSPDQPGVARKRSPCGGGAREVGISAPSVYRHFKNKAELVTTVLDVTYRALAVVMSEAGGSAATG
ncbi:MULTISPECIES: TetR/AcrR family transcriptional regulator [Streptomyces]|uniref:TetR/AcrR family transcriptional regulator n=1 Tax=Streptomyces TaxID=1883 RepID=UPI000AFBD66A|nr:MULTISPECIES: TetR/AcrR family transcriptional regulator [Streptomyces]MDX2520328.1 TetR/AcrR family transcriptional regulator [Streptomyces stelliscabiei]MDX3274896.1 TetR/AcrR family transcriptional regulator [Streptomyces scabiei]